MNGHWLPPFVPSPNPGSADPGSGVAAVCPARGTVEVFWIRPDGMVFTNARDPDPNGLNGRWSSPTNIVAPNPGSADPRSGVAAICPAPGIVEVFWIRPDGMVFTNARNPNLNGGRWNNPTNIVAPNPGSADPRSGVAAICPAPGIVEVFWIRPDGMVFTNARNPNLNGGRWNNPTNIVAPNPGSADPRSGVAAICPAPGIVEVFWIRPDGMVFTNGRDPNLNGGRWNNPTNIVAPNPGSADPGSGVAAVCPARGTVEVFWIRPDGMVFTNGRDPNLNGGRWNNPTNIVAPNPGSADPGSGVAAVCPARGIVEVFWIRPDGMVFTNGRDPNFNGGRWNNPTNIVAPNPRSADPRSGVAAICPARGTVEVFWIRPDGIEFTNARDANINGGRWNNPVPIPNDILAVHAALVRTSNTRETGSIVFFSGSDFVGKEHNDKRVNRTRLFDCKNRTVAILSSPSQMQRPNEPPDLFCCDHAFMGDGRLLVIGGVEEFNPITGPHHNIHKTGLDTTFIFDPVSLAWIEADRMPPPPDHGTFTGGRWYPTAVTLGNGDVFGMSGHPGKDDARHNNNTPGVFRASNPNGQQWHVFPLANSAFELGEAVSGDNSERGYPRAHLIPSGVIFCSTPLAPTNSRAATQMQIIDPITGRRAFVGLAPARFPGSPSLNGADDFFNEHASPLGTSVLLPLLPELEYTAKVLLFGGERAWLVNLAPVTAAVRQGSVPWNVTNLGTFADATPAPARTLVGRHGSAPLRRHGNSVILASGEVLFVGGIDPDPIPPTEENQNPDRDHWAVLDVEIFGPVNRGDLTSAAWDWSNVVAAESTSIVVPRNYHSVALLLPDGRVWCAGSSKDHGNEHESRMQIFEPWYVFESRPVIVASPEVVKYQQAFAIQVQHDRPIRRLALLRCGSATHGFNNDQRYVGMKLNTSEGSNFTATAPPSGDIAPPGMYLVFAVDDRGVPSDGRFTLLKT